jgi:hypothetical protein
MIPPDTSRPVFRVRCIKPLDHPSVRLRILERRGAAVGGGAGNRRTDPVYLKIFGRQAHAVFARISGALASERRIVGLFVGKRRSVHKMAARSEGSNIRIDYRFSAGDLERTRKYAAELVALTPDVILAGNTSTVRPLQQATRTVPIVFAGVVDPVAVGFVDSLAHPVGFARLVTFGNLTDYGINFAFVQHVLSMDSILPLSTIGYRAITSVAPSRGRTQYRGDCSISAIAGL